MEKRIELNDNIQDLRKWMQIASSVKEWNATWDEANTMSFYKGELHLTNGTETVQIQCDYLLTD